MVDYGQMGSSFQLPQNGTGSFPSAPATPSPTQMPQQNLPQAPTSQLPQTSQSPYNMAFFQQLMQQLQNQPQQQSWQPPQITQQAWQPPPIAQQPPLQQQPPAQQNTPQQNASQIPANLLQAFSLPPTGLPAFNVAAVDMPKAAPPPIQVAAPIQLNPVPSSNNSPAASNVPLGSTNQR